MEETTGYEELIVEVRKKDLILLYNFAYKLAKKQGKNKVTELKVIDLILNN